MRAPREADVLKACLAYLALRRVPAFRVNSGGLHVTNSGGRRQFVRLNSAPGCSDIIGLIPRLRHPGTGEVRTGVFLAVETKAPKGRLRPSQADFLDRVREAGGLGFVVRSVGELEAALDAEGV